MSKLYEAYKEQHLAKLQKLINKRKLKSYSQKEVAETANVSLRTIINFEQGKSDSAYLLYVYENL